jgi:hypothetical protein
LKASIGRSFLRRWGSCLVRGAIAAGILCIALNTFAQQPSGQPPQQPASTPNGNARTTAAAKPTDGNVDSPPAQSGTSNDRLFWTLPNFLTLENAGKVPPLSTGEKFKVVTRESFDYSVYPYIAFVAAISQADKSERGYGQGWGPYGERVGSAFGDATIENYMTGAIFPSLLKEDPRYYQMGKGGFWHRVGYSATRIVVTRTDQGDRQFNYSEIFGAAVAGGVSNIYHPETDRTVSNTFSVWGSQMAWDAFTFELKEFWPDIRRSVSRHKTTQN